MSTFEYWGDYRLVQCMLIDDNESTKYKLLTRESAMPKSMEYRCFYSSKTAIKSNLVDVIAVVGSLVFY